MNVYRFFLIIIFLIITPCLCLCDSVQAGGTTIHGSTGRNPANGVQHPVPASPEMLTLAWVKQIALENSPTLAAAGARVAQAIAAIEEARADYLPTVSLNASRDYTEETVLSVSDDETLYTANVSASLVLFQGFYRKYNMLAAEYTEDLYRAALDEARRSLAWNVSQTYLNACLALENIKIAQSDIDYNRTLEKEASAKERMGTGSYSDVLNYKTRVNTAKATLISAQRSYREYIFGLAALMGYEDACLPGGMEIASPAVSDTSAAAGTVILTEADILSALKNRPDLHQDSLAVHKANARINRTKAAFFPTISLSGVYGAGNSGALGGLGESDNLGASIRLEISFDIFSGGADRAAVRNVAAEKRVLENDLIDAKITAEKEIRTALSKMEAAVQTLELQQENTSLMETTRNLVHKEYNVGQASLIRMNEAQNNLVASRGDLADAEISLSIALEELDYYTGRISELKR